MARPREFDEEEALSKALEVFWVDGFEASSLDSLERATGLGRSSLYNAFGGKLALFSRVLDTYRDGPCRQLLEPLLEGHGAAALRAYLSAISRFVGSPIGARGCLMVNTALDARAVIELPVKSRVSAHFTLLASQLRRRVNEARAAGDIELVLEPDAAALLISTFVRGVLAGASSGEDPSDLQCSIESLSVLLGLAG